jgi:hypothetical protein
MSIEDQADEVDNLMAGIGELIDGMPVETILPALGLTIAKVGLFFDVQEQSLIRNISIMITGLYKEQLPDDGEIIH